MKIISLHSGLLASLALLLAPAASATLLVGFHNFDNSGGGNTDTTPNDLLGGFSGKMTGTSGAGATYGSIDGFYGPDSTLNGGIATTTASDGRLVDANAATFSVTNGTLFSYSLTSLLFDMGSTSTDATGTKLNQVSYQITGGVGSNGLLVSTGKVQGANPSQSLSTISPGFVVTYPSGATVTTQNFSDFIGNLSGITLAAGQKIDFTWGTSVADARLDNVALTGSLSAIPEPSSLLALGGVLGSGFMIRRRRVVALA